MENKETITLIKDIEEKQTGTGAQYFVVQTEIGKMSSFNPIMIEEIAKLKGKRAKLIYNTTPKGFMNLKDFKEVAEVETEKVEDKVESKRNKEKSIYTSYVKDLVIAGKTVEEAIEIIKKASSAFD